jgi:hypothetical protein
MIRGLEAQLAAWAERQLAALAAASGLFAGVSVAAGDSAAGVTVDVTVTGITPEPERHGLGQASAAEALAMHMQARVTLSVAGPAEVMAGAPGRQFTPDGPTTCQADLVALTLLALLQERSQPAADGAALSPPEPAGVAEAAEGARKAELAWGQFQPGEPVLQSVGGQRRWEIPLTVPCTFRLSVAPLEGGRILQIQRVQDLIKS